MFNIYWHVTACVVVNVEKKYEAINVNCTCFLTGFTAVYVVLSIGYVTPVVITEVIKLVPSSELQWFDKDEKVPGW